MRKILIVLTIFVLLPCVAYARDRRVLTVRDIVKYQIVDEYLSESILDGIYLPYSGAVEKRQRSDRRVEAITRAQRLDPEGTYILRAEPYRPVSIFNHNRDTVIVIRD